MAETKTMTFPGFDANELHVMDFPGFIDEGPLDPNPAPRWQPDITEVQKRAARVWDVSQVLDMDPLSIDRYYGILEKPTTLGVPLPEPIKPEMPVDQDESTTIGQLVGGFLESIAKPLADLPRALLYAGNNMTITALPPVGDIPAVLDIPGVTQPRGEPARNPVYRASKVASEHVSKAVNDLLESHPEWQAADIEGISDLILHPSKLLKAVARAVPLLASAGFSFALGSPSGTMIVMFAAEKHSAQESFKARDPEIDSNTLEAAGNIYGFG